VVPTLQNPEYPDLSSSGPMTPSQGFNILTGVVPALVFVGGIVIFFKLFNR
jgi:hypothetical protein